MSLTALLQVAAAALGFVGAFFWWRSASGKLPDYTIIGTFVAQDGKEATANAVAKRQARNNQWAAAFTGAAAACAAAAVLISAIGCPN